jgi:hypothetical protein
MRMENGWVCLLRAVSAAYIVHMGYSSAWGERGGMTETISGERDGWVQCERGDLARALVLIASREYLLHFPLLGCHPLLFLCDSATEIEMKSGELE